MNERVRGLVDDVLADRAIGLSASLPNHKM